jgi:octaprenyl-diphosphate synthase
MGTVMTSVPPAVLPGVAPRPAALTFGPVAADIEEAERVFTATLAAYRSPDPAPEALPR